MSKHLKILIEPKRLLMNCGNERIEILTIIRNLEFCPICGDKLKINIKNNASDYHD